MRRRGIAICAGLFACLCAQAQAQIIYSGDGRLYEIGADGSDRSPFTTPTSHKASDAGMDWSPDGTRLAVVHEGNALDEVYRSRIDLLSADGSSRQPVTELEPGVLVSSPRWSPDGNRLAFTRFTRRDDRFKSAIVVRDLSGDERTVVKQRLDRRLSTVGSPEWSPDGASILYSAFHLGRQAYFRSSIRVAALKGGSTQLLVRDGHTPAFSPDGSRVAFISIADQNGQDCGSDECSYNGELYVMDADGGNVQRLTHSEGDDMAPAWAPDGSRIAFDSNRNFPDGTGHEIYSIEPDGGCLTWLTNGTASSAQPAWRPDTSATDPGGCGATPRPPLVEVDLGPLRAAEDDRPLWLGLEHRGLLLSDVDRGVYLGYSDCARYRPSDCPPPLQIVTRSVCSRGASVGFLAGRIDRRRGALVQDFGAGGGLMALAGGVETHITPERGGPAPARAALRALRPFPRETPVERLRPPVIPAQLAAQIERVVRLHRRLGSVAAVAERTGLRRWTVRDRLANARALDDFGHRVRTTDC